ncbi:hypothetical protein AAFP32_04525 [Brevibacterium sp. CBA3109]|uniref:Uncharacterized protein n=1 Tax=Brevibacterium koreense TaxID=3140787 RepID=A0AAU7UNG8_9MICO
MTEHHTNPVSSTGHEWPFIGYYQLPTEKDRTERCTCEANTLESPGGGRRKRSWPMWMGWFGARTGRAVGDDVAGRYQPVTVYQRPTSKLRQLLGIGGWVAAVGYVVTWLTHSPILVDAISWAREAPAEQVAGGTVTLVIAWSTAKLIGMGIRIGQNRTRLVYVTPDKIDELRAPKPLVFHDSRLGQGSSAELSEG